MNDRSECPDCTWDKACSKHETYEHRKRGSWRVTADGLVEQPRESYDPGTPVDTRVSQVRKLFANDPVRP